MTGAAEPEELTIEAPRLRLAARAWGPRDGAPVLCLHGWLDNAASFDRLAPLLPAGLRLVALDHAGHGRSAHRGHGTYHFIDFVADAVAAVQVLGWERFALVGHSLGAGVAALVAGTLPERVSRAVLLEGLGPLTEPAGRAPERLRQAVEAEMAPERPGRPLADLEAAALVRAKASGLELGAARVLAGRGTTPSAEGLRWSADPRLRLPSRLRLSEAHVEAFLRAIACPVRVVLASRGWAADPELLSARLGAIARATLDHVEGGHHVHLEAPEAVAAAIGEFLVA